MINIKNFNLSLKIDKKSCKNMNIYYIGYIALKDFNYVNIHSVNPLYLIIDKVDVYIEEKNENKYLIHASTDKHREVLTKQTELWNTIKNLIEKKNDKLGEYGKDFVKIKFNSDNNIPLNKIIRLHNLIIVRSVFQEDNRYYSQNF